MRIYNTLTRKIEEFIPLNPPKVGMYACGPTVYDFAHIGNFRTYILADVLHRTLEYLDFRVTLVSNITDVGHLVSDADEGEDKLEKGALREGKTAWDIAKKYTNIYFEHEKKLNILPPDVRCRATDYIKQQIELVKKLEERGFTYKIGDGIYFDTGKFPDYGKLTPQAIDEQRAGARVEVNPDKKQPADFALWKFSPADKKRDMEWDSPWGKGFPGWHIECSAMGMAHLGEQFDIHVGGSDLKQIHHNNEIAQSEAATGKSPFVKYWIHGEFLMVDGEKMSKSKENFYNLESILEKGFEPPALRYLYLSTHYRSFLNFTWEGLAAAQTGLDNLRELAAREQRAKSKERRAVLSEEKLLKIENFSGQFRRAVENDLAIPEALAIVWEMAKSNIPSTDKRDLIADFDQVLGLNLLKGPALPRPACRRGRQGRALSDANLPEEIRNLVNQRETARKNQDFKTADRLRGKILAAGYRIEDSPAGPKLYEL